MPLLTAAQRQLIAQKSRTTRPSVYVASLQARQPIDKETEDALILLSAENKAKAADYLKAFAEREDRADKISDVMDKFNEVQASNAEQSAIEIDVAFQKFNAFRTSLLGNGNEVFTRGLVPLMQALSTGLGQLKAQKDRYNYDQRHIASAKAVNQPSLTLDQKKELLSWVPVLVSYS